MTVREDALAALAADLAIQSAFNATSAGDRSVLGGSLDRANSVMMTSIGSTNDTLWTCFIRHGWMEDSPVPADMKALAPGIIQRRLTEKGRRALPVILPILFAENREA